MSDRSPMIARVGEVDETQCTGNVLESNTGLWLVKGMTRWRNKDGQCSRSIDYGIVALVVRMRVHYLPT